MKKNDDEPREPESTVQNMQSAARCGAKTRRGTPCMAPAMRDKKRCRLHGGKSTGPRTPEGLARSRKANWKHGHYSKEYMALRELARKLLHVKG